MFGGWQMNQYLFHLSIGLFDVELLLYTAAHERIEVARNVVEKRKRRRKI